MTPDTPGRFDPLRLLAAIQKRHASFILIGALARITRGTDEPTHGVDITPWMRPTTLDNLELALADVHARRADDRPLVLDTDEPVIELQTDFGQLKIVPQPAGTRGYEDLHRAATYEHLGNGVRPHIASVGDLIRMAGALGRDYNRDLDIVQQLRRIAELQRELGIGLEL